MQQLPARVRIPDKDFAGHVGGDHPVTIRRPGQDAIGADAPHRAGDDSGLMAGKGGQFLPAGSVPNLGRLVTAGGQNAIA